MKIAYLNLVIASVNLGCSILSKNWMASFGWAAATVLALQIIVLTGDN